MNKITSDVIDVLLDEIAGVHEAMPSLSYDDRLRLRDALMKGYCDHCGSEHLPCYCWNNE